jgi:prepilin-type processing-associated H-X9-DG protein/prepilin-type N-terminal cleavage/methylation domain-containing protein
MAVRLSSPQERRIIRSIKAFTLVEMLVVISVIGLVMAMMLPSLGRARGQAKAVVCASNVRQLGIAWTYYAGDYDGFAMPAAEEQRIYWWGRVLSDGIDHKAGFLWPYLNSGLKESGVYECPEQRFGSYGLQGKPATEPDDSKWITSTFGYNGYYLSSPKSGWSDTEDRPWQKIATVKGPDKVFVFADTLIDLPTGVKNTALLDPPDRYEKKGDICRWVKNEFPTTCFRHNNKVNVIFVDGHCGSMDLEGAEYTSQKAKIGSVGVENSPHYVPDWRQWPVSEGGRRRR